MLNTKRLVKSPGIWIVLVLGVVFVLYSLSNVGGFQEIKTSEAETLISTSKVETAKMTPDALNLTLKKGETFSGENVKDATRVQALMVQTAQQQPEQQALRHLQRAHRKLQVPPRRRQLLPPSLQTQAPQ